MAIVTRCIITHVSSPVQQHDAQFESGEGCVQDLRSPAVDHRHHMLRTVALESHRRERPPPLPSHLLPELQLHQQYDPHHHVSAACAPSRMLENLLTATPHTSPLHEKERLPLLLLQRTRLSADWRSLPQPSAAWPLTSPRTVTLATSTHPYPLLFLCGNAFASHSLFCYNTNKLHSLTHGCEDPSSRPDPW